MQIKIRWIIITVVDIVIIWDLWFNQARIITALLLWADGYH